MKKTIALFLALMMVLGLAACGSKAPAEESKEDTPAAPVEEKKEEQKETIVASSENEVAAEDELEIGYVVSTMSHEWYQNVCAGVERRAEEKGVKVSVADAQMDSSKQIDYAENFINQGVDALIVTPVDPSTMNTIAFACKEAGIKLVAESSAFEGMDCFTGISDFDASYGIGVWMAKYAAENNIDMKILVVGQPIYEACVNRVKGFLAGLDAEGAAYEVVQEVDGSGTKEDSLEVCNDALTAHPEVNVIFGINDNSATGGMNAYMELGYDESKLTVLGFGFEGTVGRDALLSGSAYKAAVAMFPDYVGAALIDSAIMLCNGVEMDNYACPTTVITNENFAEYYTANDDGTYTTNFASIDKLLQ